MQDILQLDAITLAARIRDKSLSPVEVVSASIERMEKLEPELHAFCTPTTDSALLQAKKSSSGSSVAKMPGRWPGSRWRLKI